MARRIAEDAPGSILADGDALLRTKGRLALSRYEHRRRKSGISAYRKLGMPFKQLLIERTEEAVQACMDAGLAPAGDARTVAIDLRTAVAGMLVQRINEPDLAWPEAAEQLDRFLAKLVGLSA